VVKVENREGGTADSGLGPRFVFVGPTVVVMGPPMSNHCGQINK